MSTPRWVRVAISVALALALVVIPLIRARSVAKGALASCDAALLAGEVDAAIVHARRAAAWYAPGPYRELAYRKLHAISDDSLRRGDAETALAALRAVRAASIGSRNFLSAWASEHDAERRHADEAIARIAADQPGPGRATSARVDRERAQIAALAIDDAPRPGGVAMILLGFAALLGGGIFFGVTGLDEKGVLRPGPAQRAAAVVVLGAVAWIAGLWLS